MESTKSKSPQLFSEFKLYKVLQGGSGIPKVLQFGSVGIIFIFIFVLFTYYLLFYSFSLLIIIFSFNKFACALYVKYVILLPLNFIW